MPTPPKIIEGTWEDILKHAPALAGRRVRVTVIDEVESPPSKKFDRDEWVKSLYEWAESGPRLSTPADDSRDTIYAERLEL